MDQLHREEHFAFSFAYIEHAANRGMRDRPRHPYFVEDAGTIAAGLRPDELESHGRSQHEIVGAPDLAHPAAAQQRDHPIASGERLAGGKSRRASGSLGDTRGHGTRRVMELQQRLDLPAELRVGAARVCDKRRALAGGQAQRMQKQLFGALVSRQHSCVDKEFTSILRGLTANAALRADTTSIWTSVARNER